MNVSFIMTVYNEEETIGAFLESLLKQTKLPDEIIITDAGSTDKTVNILKKFQLLIKLPTRIIIKEGNRSVGRNTSIKKATGEIIVCTDGGCILDKNWIKRITLPFKRKEIAVVAGFYQPLVKNIFEACLATYTCVMREKVDPDNFLPSSRSIAFRKLAWEKIGGYPEYLSTCEDLVFARRLKEAGFLFTFQEDALVYWPQRNNIFQAFRQFYSYAVGDGRARYIRAQTPFLFLRYVFGICFLITALKMQLVWLWVLLVAGIIFYVFWAIRKNYKYVKKFPAFLYLPLLQFTADAAVLSGTSVGLIQSLRKDDKFSNGILIKILFCLLFFWVLLGFFTVFYNTLKVIPEIKEWMFLSDYDKRHKIFGDLYPFFLFVKKYTKDNADILIYSNDVKTYYLGIYYLYPRMIFVVDKENDLIDLIKKRNYSYVALYKNKAQLDDYKRIGEYKGEGEKEFWSIYVAREK